MELFSVVHWTTIAYMSSCWVGIVACMKNDLLSLAKGTLRDDGFILKWSWNAYFGFRCSWNIVFSYWLRFRDTTSDNIYWSSFNVWSLFRINNWSSFLYLGWLYHSCICFITIWKHWGIIVTVIYHRMHWVKLNSIV